MQFSQIKGQNNVIRKLISTIDRNQFPHAVLINGKDGYGNLALALALAQYLSCINKSQSNADSCGECPSCRKYQKLIHPDLHLIFPTNTTNKVKKDNKSSLFYSEFREFVFNNGGYGDLNDWLTFSGVEGKQGIINVADANDIVSLLTLKAYEAQYKIMVVWNIDKMNTQASNTILKILEEPYPNTVFIFTTENKENILPTILSRVQQINIGPIDNDIIEQELRILHPEYSEEEIKKDAFLSEGNILNIRQAYIDKVSEYFQMFIELNRLAFSYKTKVSEILTFTETFSKMSKDIQKDFLAYCSKTIEKCWQYSIGMQFLQHPLYLAEEKFKKNYPKFITKNNLEGIFNVLEKSQKNIDRNANVKINMTNMIIKLGVLFEKR